MLGVEEAPVSCQASIVPMTQRSINSQHKKNNSFCIRQSRLILHSTFGNKILALHLCVPKISQSKRALKEEFKPLLQTCRL